ncbi:beta strand repeat-containing protein [Rhizobium sp.]
MALSAGSIAFTGYDRSATTSFTFATLEDIPAGTVITFTNDNWNGSVFEGNESTWTWTAGSDIAAGTIVTLDSLATAPGQTMPAPTSNLGTVSYSGVANAAFFGDTMIAYTGSAAAPSFIAAFATYPYATWNNIDGTGLSNGVDSVNLLNGSDYYGNNPWIDGAEYVGPTSGFATFDDYLMAINNVDNWAFKDDQGNAYGAGAPQLPLDKTPITVDAGVQTINFDPSSVSISEPEGDAGQTFISVTINRSGTTRGDLDFTGSFVFGDGLTAGDFGGAFPSGFSGTIPDGQSSVTIQIPVTGDIRYEGDESFTLVLDTAENSQNDANIGGAGKAHVTIENDDLPQAVSFASASQSVTIAEGDDGSQVITFTVERANSTLGDLGFVVELKPDQVNSDDFGGKLPTVIAGLIRDGQSSATFSITLTGDQRFEMDELFRLVIISAENTEVGAVITSGQETAYVTITNDENAVTSIGEGEISEGQIVIDADDHVTIAAGGKVAATGAATILWTGTTTEAILDNAGKIGSDNLNKVFDLNGVTGKLTINNALGGEIVGGFDAGGLGATGSLTINNAGLISAGNGVINLSTSGGVITINNLETGTITRNLGRTDIFKDSANAVFNNWGKIVSPSDIPSGNQDPLEFGGDAIDLSAGAGNTVHNYDGGIIEGSRHGITGSRGVTVINEEGGLIVGRNGSGINFDNNTNVTRIVTVTNHGTIIGQSRGYSDSDGDAIDADGLLNLTNYGLIAGMGASGYKNGGINTSEALAIGGGTIVNHENGTIYSVQRAIQVDDSEENGAPAAVSITNAGVIHARDGEAINIIGDQQDTLVNSGTIIGDVVMGGGNDTVTLSNGSIIKGTLFLGAGDDTLTSETGNALIEGGAGNDTIIGGAGTDALIYSGNRADYTLTMNADGSITITDTRMGDGDGIDIIRNVEELRFADGTRFLTGDDYNTAPADITVSSSTIDEDAGKDAVVGVLSATDADGDKIVYTLDDDAGGVFDIILQDGEYRLVVKAALDFETAASYDITVSASDGVAETSETLTINIGDVADLLKGTKKDNKLDGAETADHILGLAGKDKINGRGGDDIIVGGAGADKLTGGQGADVFVFANGDIGKTKTTADLITDFNIGDGDVIDLSAIDAKTRAAGNQAFTFIDDDKFGKQAGELRAVAEKGATVVYGDTNGDGKADFMLRLDPGVALTEDQFAL